MNVKIMWLLYDGGIIVFYVRVLRVVRKLVMIYVNVIDN